MCLAVPGKLVEWVDHDPILAQGVVEFGGVRKACHLACVLDAKPGDYLLVHAGVAICLIQAEAAEQLIAELALLREVDFQ
jgi:hydrogenase expression/formation protein HypC